jgi:uncharacterized protein YukE
MSITDRINGIQSRLRELIDEMELLKQEFSGEAAPTFDETSMGVLEQLNDIASCFKEK